MEFPVSRAPRLRRDGPGLAPRGRAGGFTILEIMVVLTILTVAIGFMAQTVGSLSRLGPINRETARAVDAARAMAGEIRAANFSFVFVDYNADPADDPGGVGLSPSCNFDAFGLQPRADDADGRVGRIEFPVVGNELREDVVDPTLGMPRDLNGDGVIDALDHSADYQILPFRIRLEWNGRSGDRTTVTYSTVVRP